MIWWTKLKGNAGLISVTNEETITEIVNRA